MKSVQIDRELNISDTYEELIDHITNEILETSKKCIELNGLFSMALSSGILSRGVYSAMTGINYRDKFDWQNMHFFWADERWVEATSGRSHYGLAAEVLLTRVDIPIENIHPIMTNFETIEQAGDAYERSIRSFFSGNFAGFDLCLLELGNDGHIASIFEDHESLVEAKKWVMPVSFPDDSDKRLTLTLSFINQSTNILMFASGKEKSEAVYKAVQGKFSEDGIPAQAVTSQKGSVHWYLDKAASSLI